MSEGQTKQQTLIHWIYAGGVLLLACVTAVLVSGCQGQAQAVDPPVVETEVKAEEEKAPAAPADSQTPPEAASTPPAAAVTNEMTTDPRTVGSVDEAIQIHIENEAAYSGSSASGGAEPAIPSYPSIEVAELPERSIALASALSDSLENNLEIQVKVVDVDIKESLNRQTVGAFNPVFTLEGRFENLDRPQNTQDFVSTGGNALILARDPRIFNEDNYRFKASIEGKLPTGTEYEIFTEYDIIENTLSKTSPLSLFTPEHQVFSGVRLTQPLLRNFGTNVNMAEIRVARKDKRISKLELKDAMLQNISNTLIAYFDIIYLVQDYRLKQEEFELAKSMTEKRREALEKGQVSARELSRAESAMAEVIEELIIARNKVIERQTQLVALIADTSSSGPLSLIIPTTSLPVPEQDIDLNRLLAEAFSHRPLYQIAKRTVEREEIKLIYAENQIWPQLDLKATAGYNGLSSNFTSTYNKAFGDTQGEQWSVGAVFSVPLGNDIAIGRRNEVKLQKEKALLNLRNAEMQTSLLVQQLVTIIKSNYDRLDAMRAFSANASRMLETEEERLEKGQTTELELMKFRRDLNKAKVRETAALADLNKAYVKLYETTGTLLERNNIAIAR
ncbi:MAG: TolC family protein [Verrucomicrobiota bacterium]